MRGHILCAKLGIGAVLATVVLVSPGMAAKVAAPLAENERGAKDLVSAALKAEIAGDRDRRAELLNEALDRAPDYPPARWHAGYVRVGQEWLSLDEAEARASADERLAEYRRLRAAQAGTPMGELALARWCRKKQLEAEARVHWLKVLRFQPQHEEALKSLGMRWDHERLRTHAEIKQAKEQQADSRTQPRLREKHWKDHWTTQVKKWLRAIEQSDADVGRLIQEELRSIEDITAAQILDRMVWEQGRSKKKKEQEHYRTLGLKLIEILDATAKFWASSSLARHAVFHPTAEVRTAAVDALSSRPMRSYVPLLLAHMRTPVEASFAILTSPEGDVIYQHSFYSEGAEADYVETHSESNYIRSSPILLPQPNADQTSGRIQRLIAARRAQAAREFLRARAKAAATAARTQRRVEEANAAKIQLNRRVQYALSRATGVDLEAHPKYWQKWWNDSCYDYYEYDRKKPYEIDESNKKGERGGKKPVYEKHFFKPLNRVSCFPQGTKVWTLTGQVPIEEIKPGDRVLSQHPKSGELAYKPVLETTTRNPVPMIKIDLGSETIAATRGHPFWVSGEGWQMAKQLTVGASLHGISGAVSVDGLEELPAAKPWYEFAHNLIVDDFHTYFVGDGKILVHDNRLFVSDGISHLPPVPGLVTP